MRISLLSLLAVNLLWLPAACGGDEGGGGGGGRGGSGGGGGAEGGGGAATSSVATTAPASSSASGGGEGGSGGDRCGVEPGSQDAGPVVRMVYLVPTDRTPNPSYITALESAAKHLQVFYGERLDGGRTFRLGEPIVEVVTASHNESHYREEASGDEFLWFWNNVTADAFALTGGGFSDPDNVWIYYIDAAPACGQYGGAGTSGVAVLPANDLRGLAGEPIIDPCGDPPPPEASKRCRWVGGLGHEMGHAFGLPHPPGCEDGDSGTACEDNALMWLGYISYPAATLTSADQTDLAASPFFSPATLETETCDCAVP